MRSCWRPLSSTCWGLRASIGSRDRASSSRLASATLGAIFFIGNGFSIERLIVGHVGFHLFPLSALILWVLVDRRWSDLTRGAIAGLAIAVTMYQAGFFLLIVMALTVALCLPLVEIVRAGAIDVRRVFRASSVAIVFGMLISAPKIVAALMLMRQFPRQIADQPSGSIVQGLAGLAAQLAGVETLTPLLAIANVDVARVYGVFLRFIGGDFGIWELDAGVSPILFACLAIGGWSTLMAWRKGETARLGASQTIALVCLAIGGWIVDRVGARSRADLSAAEDAARVQRAARQSAAGGRVRSSAGDRRRDARRSRAQAPRP